MLGRGLGLPYPHLQWVWQSNVLSSTQGVTTLTFHVDRTAHTLNIEQSGVWSFWYDIPTNAYHIVRLEVLSLSLWRVVLIS